MFLIHKKGLARNGALPTILWGYGGFNISATPVFSATLFQWLDAGGLYAVPNLRGGGEYGERWHEAGMLAQQAEHLRRFHRRRGVADRQRLHDVREARHQGWIEWRASHRRAVVTQRPDLVRAAFVEVPLLDMLRYQNFLMARYWVPEYGSAEDAVRVRLPPRLLAVSPRQGRHEVPGGVPHRGRARHARARAARAKDGGAASGVHRRPTRPNNPCSSGSIATRATVRASP